VTFLGNARPMFPNSKRVLVTAYADTHAAIAAINRSQVDYYLLKAGGREGRPGACTAGGVIRGRRVPQAPYQGTHVDKVVSTLGRLRTGPLRRPVQRGEQLSSPLPLRRRLFAYWD
jgi:hypothetical protein